MANIHIYTGKGKGKTTAALGIVMRAVGAGKHVAVVQFDKGFIKNEHYSERRLLRRIKNVNFFGFGKERLESNGTFRFDNTEEDYEEAKKALSLANQLIKLPVYYVIVLDEIITCAHTRLLNEQDIIDLIKEYRRQPTAELILTGRGAGPRIIALADLVTECTEVKHYFRNGIPPRWGIDY